MDPLHLALKYLADHGVHFERVPEPWLNLYTAPGYPELTSRQVAHVARQMGFSPTTETV